MACDSNKFVISKGVPNTFVFTIKQDNSTMPMIIAPEDLFSADLIDLDSGDVVIANTPLATVDAAGGKVELHYPAAIVAPLLSSRGPKVDRYYLRPSYKLLITCSTANNGDFVAKVPEVYVD